MPTSSSPDGASSPGRPRRRGVLRRPDRPPGRGRDEGVAACADFDPETAMTPKEARRTDRFTQLAVAAADQAAAEAGLTDGVDPRRVGVIVGTGVGGLTTLQRECKTWLEEGDRAVSPLFVPMMMPNAAAGQIAMRLGAHGPGFSLASACSTGAHAIGEATRMIERGEVDAVIAGGTEAALVGLCLAAFRRMGALSREGVSRPFDARRDGFVMGEGAGGAGARARGARAAPAARQILGARRGLRRVQRRVPHHPARGERRAARRGDETALADAGRRARRRRLRQRARHVDARSTTASRRRPSARCSARTARRSRRQRARRPHARRRRRDRGARLRRGAAPRRAAADARPRGHRPRVRGRPRRRRARARRRTSRWP